MVVFAALILLAGSPDCAASLQAAEAALSQNNIAEAKSVLTAAARSCEKSARYFELLGAANDLSGDAAGAERAFEKATSLAPQSARLFAYLGSAYLRDQKTAQAIRALERSVTLDSSDARVLFTLGTLLARQGDYRKAAQYLSRIPDEAADDAAYFNLGLAYSHSGQFEKAREAYFRAIDKGGGNTEAYCQIGLDYASAGEPRKAIPWLFRARQLAGDRPDLDYALIEQLVELKYLETAAEISRSALEKNEHEPLLLTASGDIARQRDDFANASSFYRQALQQKPGLIAATAGLAQIAMAENKISDARKYLSGALQSDPDNALANGQLGMLDAKDGNWESALPALQKAWAQDKSKPLIGLELAKALRHSGHLAEALALMNSLKPRLHEASAFHTELAQLYLQQHQTENARAERELTASLEARNHSELHFEDPKTYVH